MAHPISIRLMMKTHASKKFDELMEQFEYAQMLILLTTEGKFHSYPIENREQDNGEFYVDLIFGDMKAFKEEKEVFENLQSVHFESDNGELFEFKSLESLSVIEVVELSDMDTILYNPKTLEALLDLACQKK